MPPLSLKPASEYTIPFLADLMTRSFEGYFVPINITDAAFLTMLRRDGIDLNSSRVLAKDDEPVGVALIAPRLDESTRGDGDCVKLKERRRGDLGDAKSHRRS